MNSSSARESQIGAREGEESRQDLEQANQELQLEVDEHRRTEAALRAYARRLDHQRATQVAILSAQSLDDTLEISIRHIKNVLPSHSSTVFTYDIDRGEADILKSSHPSYAAGQRVPIYLWDAVEIMRQGQEYYVREITDLVGIHPMIQSTYDQGGRTMLMVPLQYRNDLIGALTIVTDHVHEFSPDELATAREIANTLAVAIQYRRWLAAEQEGREREAALREVAQSLTADLDLDSVLHQILTQLERLVPTASSGIFLREESRMVAAATRGTNLSPGRLEEFSTDFPAYMQRMMATGQSMIIPDTRTSPDFVVLEGAEYVRSWMGIPLTAKGVSLGILTLDRDRPNAFGPEDLATASTLAAYAAIGIQNARLYAAEQKYATQMERTVNERTRELQALYEISASSENLELEQLLALSLGQALDAVGYTAGMIHLADETNGALTLVTSQGLPYAVLGNLDPRTAGGQAFHVRLAEIDTLWAASSATAAPTPELCAGYQSCIVAPLRAQGVALGVMTLLNAGDRPLPPESLKLLSAIADQIGLAVESADLRRQARQAAVLAERERIAADLHDMVSQSLYSLILLSEAARESGVQGDIEEMQVNLRNIMQTAQQVLGEMRTVLYDLRSDVLAGTGLAGALAIRLTTVEQPSGLVTRLDVRVLETLPPSVEDVLYRVALESLNNVLRHAGAHKVEIVIKLDGDSAVLTIADDGRGFEMNSLQGSPGMGMHNMRGRVQGAGGTLLVQSAHGQGTYVEARVPLGQFVVGRPGGAARQSAKMRR